MKELYLQNHKNEINGQKRNKSFYVETEDYDSQRHHKSLQAPMKSDWNVTQKLQCKTKIYLVSLKEMQFFLLGFFQSHPYLFDFQFLAGYSWKFDFDVNCFEYIDRKDTFENFSGIARSSLSQMFFKIGVLKNPQISQENIYVGVSF